MTGIYFELAGASPGEGAERAAEFRRAFRDGGPQGYWQKNLEETLKQLQAAEAQYLPALDVADAYARVGNNEKTLEWLEKSYAQRDGNLTLVKSYPEFKDIRKDPRFRDLLRRIGLPD